MPAQTAAPSPSDILLVTCVVGRMEQLLAETWHIRAPGLLHSIDALHGRGVSGAVIAALHYLRIERNHVLHHPCRPLRDPARYRSLAQWALPVLARRGGTHPPVCGVARPPVRQAPALKLAPLQPAVQPVDGLRGLLAQRRAQLLASNWAAAVKATGSGLLDSVAGARLRAIQARLQGPHRL